MEMAGLDFIVCHFILNIDNTKPFADWVMGRMILSRFGGSHEFGAK